MPAVVSAVERTHRRSGALATGWPLVRWARRLRRTRCAGSTCPAAAMRRSAPRSPARPASSAPRSAPPAAHSPPAPPTGSPTPGRGWCAARRRGGGRPRGAAGPRRRRDAAARPAPALVGGGRDGAAAARRRSRRWARCGSWVWPVWAYLQLDDAVPTPDLKGFPVPTVLLLGGLLLGLLLGGVMRWVNGIGARRRGRVAARRCGAGGGGGRGRDPGAGRGGARGAWRFVLGARGGAGRTSTAAVREGAKCPGAPVGGGVRS